MESSSPIPGQRLSSFAEEWRKAGADPALVQLVHFGHKIKFEHGTPTLTKPLQEFETKLEEGAMNVVRKEVATLLEKDLFCQERRTSFTWRPRVLND